jgi:hypothetical protein
VKNPTRTVTSRWDDVVTFDFEKLTVTTKMNDGSDPEVEQLADKAAMWRRLREVRATFGDRSF